MGTFSAVLGLLSVFGDIGWLPEIRGTTRLEGFGDGDDDSGDDMVIKA